jgi:ribosomal protein S18 acetylase RimI-like enzyme
MGIARMVLDARARASLIEASAVDFLHGCVGVTQGAGGWVRPERFTPAQMRMLGSCMAWRPGTYRRMARTTSGVRLRFRTDATEVALAVRLDPEPRDTAAQLAVIDAGTGRLAHDGVSYDVDGRHVDPVLPAPLASGIDGVPASEGASLVVLRLEDEGEAPGPGMVPLPGFGRVREVTVWLPCLRGCEVSRVWLDGSAIEPVEGEGSLLVLGDSIPQGFFADDPARTWPALLAQRLGLDLVNQSLYGQVFQDGTCTGLGRYVSPELVVVAFGTNYRFGPCAEARTRREVETYLAEVAREWPEVPTWVLTPIWHDELKTPVRRGSCYARVPSIIRDAARAHPEMRVADGERLVSHDGAHIAADADHPTPAGHEQLAGRLYVRMRADDLARLPPELRRRRALSLLEGAAPESFPMAELLRRGEGEVLFAEDGCLLVRAKNGDQMLFSPDRGLGRLVMGELCEPTLVDALGEGLEREVREVLGLDLVEPYHIVTYDGSEPIPVDAALAPGIRPLDASFARDVVRHYSFARFLDEGRLASALEAGLFLGAFEGEELVGFVGEHEEGSIGMLEVFPGHRKAGWGAALEATKANAFLAAGQVPWTEVYPYNKGSVRLHRRLGFSVLDASLSAFVSRGPREPGEGA